MKSFKPSPHLGVEDCCRVRCRVLEVEGQLSELHICIQAVHGDGFQRQIEAVELAYSDALEEAGFAWDSALLRRFFLSDSANQEDLLRESYLARSTESDPVALSVIEQPPLPSSKLALWAYHVRDPRGEVEKQGTRSGIALRRGALEHRWSTRLGVQSDDPDPDGLDGDVETQTRAAFDAYRAELQTCNATLRDHVLRTWIFVPAVDLDYGAMNAARRALFLEEGLCPDTHYLASTGIAGRTSEHRQKMILEAYAIAGIHPDQVCYLKAPDHLGPTHEYGVTFERGVSIQYGDRRHVLISGTASIDPAGRVCHPGDVIGQTRRAFANVKALLSEASCGFGDIAQMIVYLRDPSDQEVVQAWLTEHFPEAPFVLVHAPVCRPGWLIEVECSAILKSEDARWAPF